MQGNERGPTAFAALASGSRAPGPAARRSGIHGVPGWTQNGAEAPGAKLEGGRHGR